MNAHWVRLAVFAFCCAATSAQAQEVMGFVELRGTWLTDVTGRNWQLVERARPSFAMEVMERVKLSATVEAGFTQGRNTQEEVARTLLGSEAGAYFSAGGLNPGSYANPTLRINGADDYLDVDRLYLDIYQERFDLRVGRQALNWGSAQFFNPTDPFPQVLLAEPWRPRRGVNAIRLHVALADEHDLTAVLAANDVFTELRAAARLRLHFAETDIAFLGAYRGANRNFLAGVDLRGTLGVGWWIEGAYLFGPNPHEEVAVGIDYSFPILERATAFLQYYRNGGGATRTQDYPPLQLATNVDTAQGAQQRDPFAPFTVGRDYGLFGATLQVTPLFSSSVAMLQNLHDGTGMIIPTISCAVRDWLDVSFSAQIPYWFWGNGGEFKPNRSSLRVTVPAGAGGSPVEVDLSGLVPTSTFTLWTRANF